MTPHRTIRTVAQLAFGLLMAIAITDVRAYAHEGHAPLPTKGAQVDVQKGTIVLSGQAREALGVQTAEVALRPSEQRVLAYVNLVAPWQGHAYVTTRIPGRIVKLYVKPGESVTAGQPLAEVQSPELENLQLHLLNAQNDVLLSEKLLKQNESLAEGGVVAGRRFLEASSKHQENLNALEMARLKLLGLGLTPQNLERILRQREVGLVHALPILSPIQGTIIHADLTIGRVVQPTEHLFEIVDLSKVWGKIQVLESDLYKVAVGQPVEIRLPALPGQVFRGVVQVKGMYLDPTTHLGSVWTELANPPGQPPRLLPGMFGQAQIIVPSPNKLLTAPASALVRDGAERFVLVEEAVTKRASEYRKRNVVVVRQTAEFVQFRSDAVFPGDRVVTVGSHELFNFFIQGVLRLSKEASENIGLRVEEVGPRVVENILEVDGLVDVPPNRRDFVSAPLAGTIQRINVDRGQLVRAGDVLAEIASLEFQDLQLELLQSHLQFGLLENTLQRLRNLDESQLLARRQLWETESLYNATLNRRDNLKRRLESMGLSQEQVEAILTEKKFFSTLPLRATISGAVVHFDKVLGQVVQPGEPLFEVHDLSRVWIEASVSERDIAKIRIGQQARVRLVADPQFVGNAVVVRSGQVVGTENRTLGVWLELSDQPPAVLQHNMLARLSLTIERPAATLAVPQEALVREGMRAYVFVQQSDGKFERRGVDTGRADDRYVEITRGLEPREKVAVWGAAELATAYASLR